MKLYYAPGTCSMADHIALHEAGLAFELEKVDLRTKLTESGADFASINPKGYVPALVLDSGETLTENIAILEWIAQQHDALRPASDLERARLMEALAFISTEIHQQYGAYFSGGGEEQKTQAAEAIKGRTALIARTMVEGDFLLGPTVSVADFYLFVMLLWAKKRKFEVPEKLVAYRERMSDLPSVRQAMTDEGLV